jgi:hypothetical protein
MLVLWQLGSCCGVTGGQEATTAKAYDHEDDKAATIRERLGFALGELLEG